MVFIPSPPVPRAEATASAATPWRDFGKELRTERLHGFNEGWQGGLVLGFALGTITTLAVVAVIARFA